MKGTLTVLSKRYDCLMPFFHPSGCDCSIGLQFLLVIGSQELQYVVNTWDGSRNPGKAGRKELSGGRFLCTEKLSLAAVF